MFRSRSTKRSCSTAFPSGCAHGETKALFGVAGSGKSVLLKLAIGLMRPDSGRIFVLGEEVTRMTEQELFELRRHVGIVFQESALFDSLKVWENVAFRLMEEKIPFEEIERRVREVAALRRIGATPMTCFPQSFLEACAAA